MPPKFAGENWLMSDGTIASAKLHRMGAFNERRVVAQLQIVRVVVRLAHLRSAADECFLNFECGNRVVGILPVGVMLKLKPRLVDDGLIDDRGLSKLNALLGILPVVSARRKLEPADALDTRVLRIVVTSDQRVVLVDLKIDSGTERRAAAGYGNVLLMKSTMLLFSSSTLATMSVSSSTSRLSKSTKNEALCLS